MSYSSELKHQLAEKEIKRSCCRRALLYGILSSRAEVRDGRVMLTLEGESVAPLAAAEIRRTFGTEPLLSVGRMRTGISFASEQAVRHLESGELSYPEKTPPCPHCLSHFLRGIFLAIGRMSDYHKLYRLEFSAGERCDALYALLSDTVGEPKCTERREEHILYYKTNAAICDVLAAIGAEASAFDLINDNIEAGYRNAANRRANCEARNIERAVDASMRFLSLYRRLETAGKLKKLPEELQETAGLRAEFPTASLTALGGRCTPPISKSGMNNRLKKIEQLAKELLAEEEE